MAKFKMNKMVESASGKVGNMVFRQVGRTTLYTQAPEREHLIASEGQLAQRQRFKRATDFAKSSLLNPEVKTMYEKRSEGEDFMNAFSAAIADYLHTPKIDSVDLTAYTGQAGESIKIQVFETTKVVSAKVTIALADNTLVESGEATLIDAFNWEYVTTQVNAALAGSKITFTIADSEGNKHTVVKVM